MWGVILGAIGALGGAGAMLWVYFDSKPHKEQIEDAESESRHMTAMGAASETLATAVNMLIAPLSETIQAMQARELQAAREMAHMKAEIAALRADQSRMHRDMGSIVRYVRILWVQIKEHGSDPLPPPPELAHVVWDDETGGYTGV